jgi:hypothetical protein
MKPDTNGWPQLAGSPPKGEVTAAALAMPLGSKTTCGMKPGSTSNSGILSSHSLTKAFSSIRAKPARGLPRRWAASVYASPDAHTRSRAFRSTRLHGFAGRLRRTHLPAAVVGAESPAAAARSRPAVGHRC